MIYKYKQNSEFSGNKFNFRYFNKIEIINNL